MTPFDNSRFENLHTDAFEYHASIVEIEEKSYIPEGKITDASVGHTNAADHTPSEKSYKALLDFGILDVDTNEIDPIDEEIDFIGTTSDLTVYDLGKNDGSQGFEFNVGDSIVFNPSYMGVARLMNSKFIDKNVD
jgi:predicted amino acid racemase